jgi:hypothetical protein
MDLVRLTQIPLEVNTEMKLLVPYIMDNFSGVILESGDIFSTKRKTLHQFFLLIWRATPCYPHNLLTPLRAKWNVPDYSYIPVILIRRMSYKSPSQVVRSQEVNEVNVVPPLETS